MDGVVFFGDCFGDGLVDLLIGIGGKLIIFGGVKFFYFLLYINGVFLDEVK